MILDNKSTASGAIYARSSLIFPHRIPYGLCQGEVGAVKREPKLNLIKKWGKGVCVWGGGGRGNRITLTLAL